MGMSNDELVNQFKKTIAGTGTDLSVGGRFGVGGNKPYFNNAVTPSVGRRVSVGAPSVRQQMAMAQMGGPVISTFACGNVVSPVLMPGTADVLIALEQAAVLRDGFIEMLKPGGTILMANTRILPVGFSADKYPTDKQIDSALRGYTIKRTDVLAAALKLGDPTGRMANVVMLGLLSTVPPFNAFPTELWHEALKRANSQPSIWAANYAAFNAGRAMAQPAGH